MTDSEEAFFKQRRNLIAISLIVSFLNIAAVELTKLNILGNELDISNRHALPLALGIALFYFVVRYLQYMHDVEDKGFRNRFFTRAKRYLLPHLLRRELSSADTKFGSYYKGFKVADIEVRTFTMFTKDFPINAALLEICEKRGGIVLTEHVSVSRNELVAPFIRSAVYVAIRTRLITDYVLPLTLAAMAYVTYLPSVRASVSHWL